MKIAIEDVSFDAAGLVPVVVQDARTRRVLTLAYMNPESLAKTLETNETWFWSRSRQEPWTKGATSGHHQHLVSALVDCDGDTVLLLVDQTGVACHTGRRNCFFRALRGETLTTIAEPVVAPSSLYGET